MVYRGKIVFYRFCMKVNQAWVILQHTVKYTYIL